MPQPEEVGATADGVVWKVFGGLLVAEVLERVGPEEVAHGPEWGRLPETVDAANVVEVVQLRWQAPMYAEELVGKEGGQGQRVAAFHGRLVDIHRVLDLAFLFEREILGEVPALVISAQHKERSRVAKLERQQV